MPVLKNKFLKDEKGASLVEIILIIVIFGIAAIPLSRLSTTNLISGARYATMNNAIFYAEEIMENIIADYNSSDGTIGGFDNVRTRWPGSVTTPSPPTSDIDGYVSFSGVASKDSVDFVTVTVTVSGVRIEDIQLKTWLIDD